MARRKQFRQIVNILAVFITLSTLSWIANLQTFTVQLSDDQDALQFRRRVNTSSNTVNIEFPFPEISFPSFMTSHTDGRAGNVISAYSSLMYYQLKYGFQAVLEDWQFEKIDKIFKTDKFKILPTTFSLPPYLSINWINVATRKSYGSTRPAGTTIPSQKFEENIEDYQDSRFINIGKFPHYLWLFKEYLPELRKQLVFQDHLQQHVDNWKKTLIKGRTKQIIFVGVHARRTDYQNFYKAFKATATWVDHYFFNAAFDVYRKKYNDEQTEVMFLAVSDDTIWIKTHLSHNRDVRFGADYSSRMVAEKDLVGFDLCVLGTSHHSIHSFGSFGMWGSLLAGGDVVVARGRGDDFMIREDEIFLYSNMPNWLYIDTRNTSDIKVLTNEDLKTQFSHIKGTEMEDDLALWRS